MGGFAEKVIEREGDLRAARSSQEHLWQELAHYFWPEKADFTVEVAPGVERRRQLLDSTGARSLELFGSFIFNFLNNPASQWFQTAPADALNGARQSVEVEREFERLSTETRAFMEGPFSRLYANLHSFWLDIGAFGVANLFTERMGPFYRTECIHLKDYVFEEDAFGDPSVVFRSREFTEEQAIEKFGADALAGPDGSRKRRDRKKPVKFVHAVIPAEPEVYRLAQAFEPTALEQSSFVGAWVNTETKQVFSRTGYTHRPYHIARWYRQVGSIYGRSPAETTLPDVRMVNRMMDTILRGAEKIVDPPLWVRDGSLMSPLRLFPGSLTMGDGDPPQPLIPPGASRIEMGNALLEQRQQAIREGFFIPLFSTPESPVKTATQVLQEADERNRAISPMVTRLQEELFQPLIARAIDLGIRAGQVQPIPDSLARRGVAVQFISPVSASQRQLEAMGVLRLFEGLAPWAQVDPQVFDGIDPDRVAAIVLRGSGSPLSVARSQDEIQRLRAARAEQQAQQEALQVAQQAVIPAVEAGAKVQAAQR